MSYKIDIMVNCLTYLTISSSNSLVYENFDKYSNMKIIIAIIIPRIQETKEFSSECVFKSYNSVIVYKFYY